MTEVKTPPATRRVARRALKDQLRDVDALPDVLPLAVAPGR